MRILHYSLGFPPYRVGGMTKYCLDLMEEQIKAGHSVGMLWPGKIHKYGSECQIKKRANYRIDYEIECLNYEIINPLPVSLLNGIKDVKLNMSCINQKIFINIIEQNNIYIIHIHTLMGLPRELLVAAKKNHVKIVYTSHDYYGICPKASLTFGNHICEHSLDCENCGYCNKGALSPKKIKLLQSPLYRMIKDNQLIKIIRKNAIKKQRKRNDEIEKNNKEEYTYNWNEVEKYKRLRTYYYSFFEMIDTIHFNSSVTKQVFYNHNVPINNEKTILITHKGLKNQKIKKTFGKTVRFSYLGGFSSRKGCEILINALDNVYGKGYRNFKLNTFSSFPYERAYINEGVPYQYSEIRGVFEKTDVLILPSIWNETFGFTVLEALSYDVPVIVSSHAGSKDLIDNKNGWIVEPEVEDLTKIIIKILEENCQKLKDINKYICNNIEIKTMREHTQEIMDKCYK